MDKFGKISLSNEEKKELIQEIQVFFEEERDESIGMFAAETVLDFFLETLGGRIYNKALDDSLVWYKKCMENVEADFYALYKESSR